MFEEFSEEFAPHIILPDKRLENRFQKMIVELGNNFGKSIPQSTATKSSQDATYNFFLNERIETEYLQLAERDRALAYIAANEVKRVLAIQDTTTLDFTGKKATVNLGCLSYEHQKGLYLHNHFLTDELGIPIGLFDQTYWSRDVQTLGTTQQRRYEPIENKESYRWLQQFRQLQKSFAEQPDVEAIFIGDSEADMYELLQATTQPNVQYIIRAKHNRKLTDSSLKSYDYVKQQEVVGQHTVRLKRRQASTESLESGQRKAKTKAKKSKKKKAKKKQQQLTFAIQYAKIVLAPPYRPAGQPALKTTELTIIRAIETNPPTGVEPIEWFIYTSLPINSLQDAIQVIRYYEYRWRIEEFHRVLKQQANVKQLQIGAVAPLQKAITFYAILCCRVLQLRYSSELNPRQELTKMGYDVKTYHVLGLYVQQVYGIPFTPTPKPTVLQFTQLLARLGGQKNYYKTKIGVTAIARGLKLLPSIINAYDAFSHIA